MNSIISINQIVVVVVLFAFAFVCQGWSQEMPTAVVEKVRVEKVPVPVSVTVEQTEKLLKLANGKVPGSFKGCKRIGEKTEKAIFEYVTVNGPFKSVDELALVKGIGVKTLQNMIQFVTVPSVPDSEEIE